MRARFLRVVLFSAAVVGIILVPALPAQAQCTHLGQQVVCPSGVSNGSMSLSFTNGSILWQAPTGSTTLSPSAGCCSPFTAPTPAPTAPSATGLTPTTAAGQNALSNAVRTPSGAVGPDRALLEAERQYQYQAYLWWTFRMEAAQREAIDAEVEAWRTENNVYRLQSRLAEAERSGEIDRLLWAAAYAEHRAREAMERGDGAEAERWRHEAEAARTELSSIEDIDARVKVAKGDIARAQEEARAARERLDAAGRGVAETYRRLDEARREAERQRTEQAQPAQPVQQAQQFTVYFSDSAAGRSEYLRGYLEARPVINQSDAANARPPAPRSP